MAELKKIQIWLNMTQNHSSLVRIQNLIMKIHVLPSQRKALILTKISDWTNMKYRGEWYYNILDERHQSFDNSYVSN